MVFLKVVLLGLPRAGKTQLLWRFTKFRDFSGQYQQTPAPDFGGAKVLLKLVACSSPIPWFNPLVTLGGSRRW
jgi:hypothetical protein